MSDYGLMIPASIADGLRTEADAAGQTMRQYVLAKLTAAQPASADPSPVSLDAAAAVLLAQLDSEHQMLIQECARETGRPISAYLLSYIHMAREMGRTAKPLPEYLERGSTQPVVDATPAPTPSLAECRWCHRSFTPTLEGQQYCPNPDDGSEPCAKQAALAEIRTRRRGKVVEPGVPAPPIVERRMVS